MCQYATVRRTVERESKSVGCRARRHPDDGDFPLKPFRISGIQRLTERVGVISEIDCIGSANRLHHLWVHRRCIVGIEEHPLRMTGHGKTVNPRSCVDRGQRARAGFARSRGASYADRMNIAASRAVTIGKTVIANDRPLALIAGPCAMESRTHALETAQALVEMARALDMPFIYKSSFDKANRTSVEAPRGIGLGQALDVFAEVKERFGCPVITDVHEAGQCEAVAKVVDVLQIPAFLCRQTDLLLAAAATGRVVNVKKGQFLAPWDMANVVRKLRSAGNDRVLLTERGASFGYNTLVSDMRALPILAETGCPVVFDATHSVQQPGGRGESSGGERRFVPVLARAAVAIGVAAVFIETHEDPDRAPSDGPNMVPLRDLPALLADLQAFDVLTKRR